MNRLFAVAVILIALAAPAFSSDSDQGRQVEKAEQARVQAMIKGDLDAFERMLADDFIYVHSSGRVQPKKEYVEGVRTGDTKTESFKEKDLRTRVYGDTAVIIGSSDVLLTRKGKPDPRTISFLAVYSKRGGRWLMSSWISTKQTR